MNEITRGERAKAVLEDELFKEAVDTVQKSILDDFSNSDPEVLQRLQQITGRDSLGMILDGIMACYVEMNLSIVEIIARGADLVGVQIDVEKVLSELDMAPAPGLPGL